MDFLPQINSGGTTEQEEKKSRPGGKIRPLTKGCGGVVRHLGGNAKTELPIKAFQIISIILN